MTAHPISHDDREIGDDLNDGSDTGKGHEACPKHGNEGNQSNPKARQGNDDPAKPTRQFGELLMEDIAKIQRIRP